jgi:hypothetical protein
MEKTMTITLMLIASLILMPAAQGYDQNNMDQVRHILLRRAHPEGPSIPNLLSDYALRANLPADDLFAICRLIVSKGSTPDATSVDAATASNGIDALGFLNAAAAVPDLKIIGDGPDGSLSTKAQLALSRIESAAASESVAELVGNGKARREIRGLIYMNWKRSLKGKNRAGIIKALRKSAKYESDGNSLQLLDSILKEHDKEYSRSFDRENILHNLEKSTAQQPASYAARELRDLRRLLKSKRTILPPD